MLANHSISLQHRADNIVQSGGGDKEREIDEVDFVRGQRTRDTDELQRSGKSLNIKRKKPVEVQ